MDPRGKRTILSFIVVYTYLIYLPIYLPQAEDEEYYLDEDVKFSLVGKVNKNEVESGDFLNILWVVSGYNGITCDLGDVRVSMYVEGRRAWVVCLLTYPTTYLTHRSISSNEERRENNMEGL